MARTKKVRSRSRVKVRKAVEETSDDELFESSGGMKPLEQCWPLLEGAQTREEPLQERLAKFDAVWRDGAAAREEREDRMLAGIKGRGGAVASGLPYRVSEPR